jgi:hypothetical protein
LRPGDSTSPAVSIRIGQSQEPIRLPALLAHVGIAGEDRWDAEPERTTDDRIFLAERTQF